jgi:hypothetical protein
MTSQCLVVTAVDIWPWTPPLQNRNILLSATSKLYLSLGRYLGHLFYCYTAMVHQDIVYLEVFLSMSITHSVNMCMLRIFHWVH